MFVLDNSILIILFTFCLTAPNRSNYCAGYCKGLSKVTDGGGDTGGVVNNPGFVPNK